MGLKPDIWLKLRPLASPERLSEFEYEAVKYHLGALQLGGAVLVVGHERNWAWRLGVSNDWLEQPFSSVEISEFAVVGVLVFARYLRNAHLLGHGRVKTIKAHIRGLIEAGVKVGGGEEGVEALFVGPKDWEAWADNLPCQFPRREERQLFCPYPREH